MPRIDTSALPAKNYAPPASPGWERWFLTGSGSSATRTRAAFSIIPACIITSTPVSYTHLDVYKRQIENYLNYADERRVTISVLEVFGGVEEPHEVYHASVPGDTPLGRDGITKCFLEHLYGCLLYTSRCV